MSREGNWPDSPVTRKGGRLRLRLPAQVITHQGTMRAVLCDLSEHGANLYLNADLACGRDMVVRWAGHEAFGTVRWQREGFHGLEFDEPVTVAILSDTRRMQDTHGMSRKAIAEWMAVTGWDFGKSLL